MASNILRVATAIPAVCVGKPFKNEENIIDLIDEAGKYSPDVILFPALCISGASCGQLFFERRLLSECMEALTNLVSYTSGLDALVCVGVPVELSGAVLAATAVIKDGALLCLVPARDPDPPLRGMDFERCEYITVGGGEAPVCAGAVLRMGGVGIGVDTMPRLGAPAENLARLSRAGAEVVLRPMARPYLYGESGMLTGLHRAHSLEAACGVAYANCGYGESSSKWVYEGVMGLAECGTVLREQWQDMPIPVVMANDFDIDVIRASRRSSGVADGGDAMHIDAGGAPQDKDVLLRQPQVNPFLPENLTERIEIFKDIYALQQHALYERMAGTGMENIVLGVSGGLDSTLALLVACETMTKLSLPRSNITAVMMPGLGTSGRTRDNAQRLLGELGVSQLTIDITEAVRRHFLDIDHDPMEKDVVYENAQARERTQILLDLANKKRALMLGTGDLSEDALGFCTVGGDALCNYNCNGSLTKGMIRGLVGYIADSSINNNLSAVLRDVLETPISPELKSEGDGGISQRTEDILGPYELHDFFLYHHVKYGFDREKILLYARTAFDDSYDADTLEQTLDVFYERFYSGQFKRAAMSEGAVLGDVTLAPWAYFIPSDQSFK